MSHRKAATLRTSCGRKSRPAGRLKPCGCSCKKRSEGGVTQRRRRQKRKRTAVKRRIPSISLTVQVPQMPPGQQGPQGPVGPPGTSGNTTPQPVRIRILPRIKRYFYIADSNIVLSDAARIACDRFLTDDGEAAHAFVDFGEEGYYNLFINAVLQEGKVYEVSPQALTIRATGQTIYAGTPIILEAVGFTAVLVLPEANGPMHYFPFVT